MLFSPLRMEGLLPGNTRHSTEKNQHLAGTTRQNTEQALIVKIFEENIIINLDLLI
jgi:hypothetical protein